MEFIVVIHAQSPFGVLALQALRKVGGATGTVKVGDVEHPFIVATDLDFSAVGVVTCTHLRNPGTPDPKPRRVVLPAASILSAWEAELGQTDPQEPQKQPPPHLH